MPIMNENLARRKLKQSLKQVGIRKKLKEHWGIDYEDIEDEVGWYGDISNDHNYIWDCEYCGVRVYLIFSYATKKVEVKRV